MVCGIWYMYVYVCWLKIKNPEKFEKAKRQKIQKAKKNKNKKMLYLSKLQTHWVTNYVCWHRGAPGGTDPGTRPANNSKHSLAQRAETQPVWGQQMEINKFNGRNANEMQIKINTKSKNRYQETREGKIQKSKTKN